MPAWWSWTGDSGRKVGAGWVQHSADHELSSTLHAACCPRTQSVSSRPRARPGSQNTLEVFTLQVVSIHRRGRLWAVRGQHGPVFSAGSAWPCLFSRWGNGGRSAASWSQSGHVQYARQESYMYVVPGLCIMAPNPEPWLQGDHECSAASLLDAPQYSSLVHQMLLLLLHQFRSKFGSWFLSTPPTQVQVLH